VLLIVIILTVEVGDKKGRISVAVF